MKTCKFYQCDGGGLTPREQRYYCSEYPWTCVYFNPNRYFCPCVKTSGGWNSTKYNEWRQWREKLDTDNRERKKRLARAEALKKEKRENSITNKLLKILCFWK